MRAQNVLRRSFRPILEAAEIDGFRFHDLRHTAATLMLRAGVHPKIVSERLGHAKVAITMDLYQHALPSMQRDAARSVEALLSAARKKGPKKGPTRKKTRVRKK